MGSKLSDESIPEIREQVALAASMLLEYKKREKEWEETRKTIEARLAGLIKRIEEFSGG